MSKRVFILIVLITLLALTRGYQLRQLISRAYPLEREVGLLMEVQNGVPSVGSVMSDVKGHPSSARIAGFQPKDQFRFVINSAGKKTEITGNFSLGEAWKTIGYGNPWTAGVERSGKILSLHVPATHPSRSFALKFLIFFVGLILPLIAITTASLIGFLRPDDDRAFVASLLFFSFSAIFSSGHYMFSPGWRELDLVLETVLASWVSYLFMRFFLLFPAPSVIDRKFPRLKTVFMILTIPITLMGIWATYLMGVSYQRFSHLTGNLDFVNPFITGFFLLNFLIGLASLLYNTLRAETLDERRKMKILLAGSVLGLVPLVIFLFYVQATGTRPISPWPLIALCLLVGFFPVSFTYVILKHRILGIRLILRRGIQYALVSRGFFIIEGLVIFLLFYLASSKLNISFSEASGFAGAFMAIIPFGIAMGLRGINQSVMNAVDRRFFRETYNAHQILSDLGRSVRRLANEPEKLFDLVTDKISDSLYPDQVAIFLRKFGTHGDFQCRGLRLRSGHHDETWCDPEKYKDFAFAESSFLAHHLEQNVIEDPETLDVYLNDPKSWAGALVKLQNSEKNYLERAMIERLNMRLIVPLVTNNCVLGYLSLGEKLSEEAYSKEDRNMLLSVADQVAIAIEYGHLIQEVAEQEKLKREIQIAKDVQSRLFPQQLPAIETMKYTGICKAARGVGGDYYDFLLLDADRLAVALGDVSGKGISSALLMASLQALLRSAAPLRGENLDLLLQDINRLLCESTLGKKYATFFYGIYHCHEKILTYVNAGHCPPMIFRQSNESRNSYELIRLTTGGMVVGIFPEAEYKFENFQLKSGDLLILYSDGISEAMNEQDEEFGEERLIQTVELHLHFDASELQDIILQEVSKFVGNAPQSDDMTLVIAKIV